MPGAGQVPKLEHDLLRLALDPEHLTCVAPAAEEHGHVAEDRQDRLARFLGGPDASPVVHVKAHRHPSHFRAAHRFEQDLAGSQERAAR